MEMATRPWRKVDLKDIGRIMADHELWVRYGVTLISARTRLKVLWEAGELGFVATSGDGVAGFALYNTMTFGRQGYIRLLGVSQGATSQGIGAGLLSAVERVLVQQDIHRLLLLCADWNDRARAFYERHGFFRAGVLPNWVMDGTDEVLYAKRLD